MDVHLEFFLNITNGNLVLLRIKNMLITNECNEYFRRGGHLQAYGFIKN